MILQARAREPTHSSCSPDDLPSLLVVRWPYYWFHHHWPMLLPSHTPQETTSPPPSSATAPSITAQTCSLWPTWESSAFDSFGLRGSHGRRAAWFDWRMSSVITVADFCQCKLVTFHLFCSIRLSYSMTFDTIIQYIPPIFFFLLWMTSEQGAVPHTSVIKGAVRLVWRVISVSS